MKVYNSLSKCKEEFKPIDGKKVNIYVCGLTVYDLPHLGHAKLYVSFDVIVRYLRHIGYDVTYVRNITDIDDKIIQRANAQSIDTCTLASTYIKEMHKDFNALGLIEPDIEPKATEHLNQIIEIIQRLIDNNSAYIADSGDVYFNVASFDQYGVLSSRDLQGQSAGKRVDVTVDKKNAEDFVLWKMSKEGEPSWDSPWGLGRPGWHIECSAMSMYYLGEYFDIHGGGYDLIFPHHENELAQSCACTGKDFVKYWLHIGYLKLNEEKMSKSTNNFFTIRELLVDYHPETIRMFLATSHYRSQQNFSRDLIAETDASLLRLYNAISGLDTRNIQIPESSEYKSRFIEAMNDDFNTSKATAILFELAHKVEKNKKSNLDLACKFARLLKELAGILGILQECPDKFLQYGFSDNSKIDINNLIQKRSQARKEKDWGSADNLRDKLENMNIELEDGVHETTWRRKVVQ
jgi:cysteinyl-tRNA synthetase